MQSVSNKIKTALEAMQPISIRIVTGGEVLETEVLRAAYNANIGGDRFTIGTAIGATATVNVTGIHNDLKDAAVALGWRVGSEAWQPLIIGYVESVEVAAGCSAIRVADIIAHTGGKLYAPSDTVLQDCTLADALADVAGQLGTTLDADTAAEAAAIILTGGVGNLAAETSLSVAAGQMAALLGGNAMISRDGKLTVARFAAANIVAEAYASTDRIEPTLFQPGGLVFRRTDTITREVPGEDPQRIDSVIDFPAGLGADKLLVENQLATQALADSAWNRIQGVQFFGGSAQIPGGILLQPGDIISVMTSSRIYPIAVSGITLDIDGGCRCQLRSAGYAPWSGSAGGSISRRMQDMSERVYNLQTTAAGLLAEAANIRGEMTRIVQTAEEVAIEAANQEVSTFMRVTAEGVEIGRELSQSTLLLTGSGVKSMIGGIAVSTMGINGVSAPLLEPGIIRLSAGALPGTEYERSYFIVANEGTLKIC